jgi:2',3'-cyclic-nucleotide 2'-phosphodiesterase (5'-nucleotidase family)
MRAYVIAVRLLVLVAAATVGGAFAAEQRITLLHINDVYQIGPVDKGRNGGLARVATIRDQVRAASPDTLLLLGGDTLSPSVASNTFRGEQMIATWNALKLDLAVPGNHEFDFGPEIFRQRVAESKFPWLADNMSERATGRPFGGTQRALVKRFGRVKVGFLGVITADTPQTSKTGPGVRFTDPVVTARRTAARLHAQGATIVVALTHLAMADDLRLARTGAVDLILGGHDHTLMQSLAGHTPIFKAGSDARLVARIDLIVDPRTRRLKNIDWVLLPVTADVAEEPAVATVVAGYESQLAALLDKPVGETTVALDARQETSRSRETNLGDWLADIYRTRTDADAALVNGGSIRSNTTYGPGQLTKRDILSILPFENPIVKLDVPGSVLRQALEHGLAEIDLSNESGRFPQVSGMRYRYDARRPVGSRLLDVKVAGAPLDDARHYALAVNSYLAGGGDGYAMLRGLPYLLAPENALSETAEVIEALAKGSPITPATDGRIERVTQP